MPRVLTDTDRDVIATLHERDPRAWDVPRLAAYFGVHPRTIERELRRRARCRLGLSRIAEKLGA